jgi:hypothetical protein
MVAVGNRAARYAGSERPHGCAGLDSVRRLARRDRRWFRWPWCYYPVPLRYRRGALGSDCNAHPPSIACATQDHAQVNNEENYSQVTAKKQTGPVLGPVLSLKTRMLYSPGSNPLCINCNEFQTRGLILIRKSPS